MADSMSIESVATEGVGVTPETLKSLFRGHPAGVAVITADAGDGPVAMTASSLFSVSVSPPLVVFSASALSSSTPTLLKAETLVVHMIDTETLDLAILGSTSGINRFADAAKWDRLPTGEPYFHGAPTRFRGEVAKRMDAGSSTLFVVHVLEAWHADEREPQPIVYHNRTWHSLSDRSRVPMR